MRRISFFSTAVICFVFLGAKAQTSFVIKDAANVKNTQPYIQALSKANMEPYRLQQKRSTLVFEPEKVLVELISAQEMAAAGTKIAVSDYPLAFPATFEMPIFSLSANGWLLARYSNEKSKFH
jgi:hypothetical protein